MNFDPSVILRRVLNRAVNRQGPQGPTPQESEMEDIMRALEEGGIDYETFSTPAGRRTRVVDPISYKYPNPQEFELEGTEPFGKSFSLQPELAQNPVLTESLKRYESLSEQPPQKKVFPPGMDLSSPYEGIAMDLREENPIARALRKKMMALAGGQ